MFVLLVPCKTNYLKFNFEELVESTKDHYEHNI